MKRRWFQIHLSTAVMLMFCAGGLLWLNVDKRAHTDEFLKSFGVEFENELDLIYVRGWPFAFEDNSFLPSWSLWNPYALIGNVVLAALILIMIAALSEFFLRRYRRA